MKPYQITSLQVTVSATLKTTISQQVEYIDPKTLYVGGVPIGFTYAGICLGFDKWDVQIAAQKTPMGRVSWFVSVDDEQYPQRVLVVSQRHIKVPANGKLVHIPNFPEDVRSFAFALEEDMGSGHSCRYEFPHF